MTTTERTDFLPLEAYIPYAERMSKGDDDLRQELFLAAANIMQKGYTYPARVIHTMQMARIAYWRGSGKSIDNGNPWNRQRGNPTPMRYDETQMTDQALTAYCSGIRNPEELALFRISFERFCTSLTLLERGYMELKLSGFSVHDREEKISSYIVTKVRSSLRRKFCELMDDDEEEEEEEENKTAA